jgi:hypothetical protein
VDIAPVKLQVTAYAVPLVHFVPEAGVVTSTDWAITMLKELDVAFTAVLLLDVTRTE